MVNLKEWFERLFFKIPTGPKDYRAWIGIILNIVALYLLWYALQPNGTCNPEYVVYKPFIDGYKNGSVCFMQRVDGICGGQGQFKGGGNFSLNITQITGRPDIVTTQT